MRSKKFASVFLQMIILMSFVFSLSSCSTTKVEPDDAVKAAETFMEKYTAVWVNEDTKNMMTMYDDDFVGYDALSPGWTYNYEYAVKMNNDPSYWASVKVHQGSFVVSQDGMFAAGVTRMDFMMNKIGDVPNIHIVAIKNGEVVYAYDYYGMVMSKIETLPVFESRTIEPGSDEAKKNIDLATKIVKQWQKAYNEKNSVGYLSCYAEDLKYVDLVMPDWRVMTKDELGKDIAAKFSRTEFVSKLGPPMKSPIPDGFFISPDGHYAVSQGTYEDKGKITARPMAVLLEIKDGKIVKQYNFMREE